MARKTLAALEVTPPELEEEQTGEEIVSEENTVKVVSELGLYHPIQKVKIDQNPVAVVMDGWVECQIEAGLVTVVE